MDHYVGHILDPMTNRIDSVAIGTEVGYLNSIDFIADRKSGARTSQQTWCKGNCTQDPVIQAVDAKIEALLGIPHENSEYFQIVKV
jgi:hypothetical protein